MKKNIVGIAVAVSVVVVMGFSGCASTPSVKDVSPTTEILEHKGSVWGTPQPEWVSVVISTPNQKTLKKALGLEDKKIWVLTKNGQELDFLQTWVDQVDARAEIASSIRQTVRDVVRADMKGEEGDEMEKSIQRYSDRIASVAVSGLEKETDWWTRNRRLKDGVKKAEGADDYVTQYSYMVVYGMDEKLFSKQIKTALEDADDSFITADFLERMSAALNEQSIITSE